MLVHNICYEETMDTELYDSSLCYRKTGRLKEILPEEFRDTTGIEQNILKVNFYPLLYWVGIIMEHLV